MWYILYSYNGTLFTVKRNQLLIHAATLMNLKTLWLVEEA